LLQWQLLHERCIKFADRGWNIETWSNVTHLVQRSFDCGKLPSPEMGFAKPFISAQI
jgi:hypothetical protein